MATALQFYVFVFLEDGQGLLTFALFALQQSLPVPSPLSGSPFRRRSSSHRWRRHHVPGILSDERLPRRDSNMTLDSTSSPAMVRYNGVPSHNSYASFLGEGSPLPLLRRRHEGVRLGLQTTYLDEQLRITRCTTRELAGSCAVHLRASPPPE